MNFSVSKSFGFCYGHRLLNDEGKCRHLHGHSAKVVVHIKSEKTDGRGMVCHFDNLKKNIGKWIEDNLDHVMILSKDDPIARTLEKSGERLFFLDENPTAENIAKRIFCEAKELGVNVCKVELWESETARASYSE